MSRGEGFHAYDNLQSGFLISYLKPVSRSLYDEKEQVTVAYPLRIAVGMQQQQFYNFNGPNRSAFVPVIHLSFF